MIPLPTIKAANSNLATRLPSPICVFVGGTTGIGSFTLKQLAASTVSPKVYYIGRTPGNATVLQKELEDINPQGTYVFLQCDVLSIKAVDECCRRISEREVEVNLLWLSAGALRSGMPGAYIHMHLYLHFVHFVKLMTSLPIDTSEGLNWMAAISYYGQVRFITKLLPLLKRSAANDHFTRVIRILAGGLEKPLDPHDLDMRNGSLIRGRQMHTTITTVAFDQLAHENPEISFVHAFAGFVKTEGQKFPGLMSLIIRSVMWIAGSWLLIPPEESGERNLFYATSEIYPPAAVGAETANTGKGGAGAEESEHTGKEKRKDEGEEVAVGLDGVKGSGCYTLHWDGTAKSGNKVLLEYRESGFREKVWEHTLAVYRNIEKQWKSDGAA
ncbi:Oxidoreductase andH [Drechslerella dactyloides]|uniref:Oxidoreductase andH n=1 Tax=Drechslerella dactyloides TaxID=74499 RepID=A0AAD6J6E7_DREDA|nr:Oxidoreductase andH [Drechslerella dactyloides]